MIININAIDGWEKDSWKITKPGNYAHFIANNKHDTEVSIFLTDSGGKGDNWMVNIGIGRGISESKNALGSHKSFDDKDAALLQAAVFMKANPEVEWNRDGFPKLTKPDGDYVEIP